MLHGKALRHVASALALGLLVAFPAKGSAPPPECFILIGAYYVPHPADPVLYPSYSYQHLAGAGFDAILNLAGIPGGSEPSTDLASQTGMVARAAAVTPVLWSIVQCQNGFAGSNFEDLTPSYSQVNNILSQYEFRNAANIYGWNTWDEPSVGGHWSQTSQLDSLVRLVNDDLGGDSTWTTHVGWFVHCDTTGVKATLELLDGHDGIGWGRRPVFGAECHPTRNLHPAHEFNTSEGNRSASVTAS